MSNETCSQFTITSTRNSELDKRLTMAGADTDEPLVIQDLRRHLNANTSEVEEGSDGRNGEQEYGGGVALPVAAFKSLLDVIQRTQSNTMMGLQKELKLASEEMMDFANDVHNGILLGGRSHISLASGCELFLKYITRCFLESPDFDTCIQAVLERGQRFSDISLAARDRISQAAMPFIRPGSTVLTHGWSRVVSSLLIHAAKDIHFELIVLEGRPDAGGARAAAGLYAKAGIPTTVVLDSAVAHVMERVDLVLVGAEGVVENGGIINKIGTYTAAVCAKELGKPFYVAAESYKFARLFPLNQNDLPEMGGHMRDHLNFVDTASWVATGGIIGTKADNTEKHEKHDLTLFRQALVQLPSEVRVDNPLCDYTPAKYITLLFTDLGVLTPSAVSDELIRLYQ